MLADIICYPIKSCAGIHLAKAEIDDLGIKDDRRWAIFLESQVISQLNEPKLLKLQPSFKYTSSSIQSHLILSYPNFSDFFLELSNRNSNFRTFELEKSPGQYVDEGDQAGLWLENVFGKKYRLGKLQESRNIGKIEEFKASKFKDQELSFASEGHFLIVSEASMETLKENLPSYMSAKLNINCFRPNLIIKNARVYEEDY